MPGAAERAAAVRALEPGPCHVETPHARARALSTIITGPVTRSGPHSVPSCRAPPAPRFLQTTSLQRSGLYAPLPGDLTVLPARVGANLGLPGFQGEGWGAAAHPHACALQSPAQKRPRAFPYTRVRSRGVYTRTLDAPRAHTRSPCLYTSPRPGAQAPGRTTSTRTTRPEPGGRGSPMPLWPTLPPLAAGPSFCNSCIYFAALSIGRGFQNTLGLFTELCENILSPLQLSLPEGSGTCPSPLWANCALCQRQPQLLKGPAGLTLRAGW